MPFFFSRKQAHEQASEATSVSKKKARGLSWWWLSQRRKDPTGIRHRGKLLTTSSFVLTFELLDYRIWSLMKRSMMYSKA
jgi:hypothetical protein